MKRIAAVLSLVLTAAVPAGVRATAIPQDRSVDPVVLTGAQFPTWSAGPDPTAREPQAPGNPGALGGGIPADPLKQSDCANRPGGEHDPSPDHSCYQQSRLPRNPLRGAPVDRLLAYRWNGEGFEQIPFQVDERFTRYLSNNASDFGAYSGVDAHNTYAFDREGWRFTDNDPADVCKPVAREDPLGSGRRPVTTPDPLVGLDDDDELVFMARDAGARAPLTAPLPQGIAGVYEISVADTSTGAASYAYVMRATDDGPSPAFTAENSPYVRYRRDTGPNRFGADLFVYSQSSYDEYGVAPRGPHCDAATGLPVRNANGSLVIAQRRPLDTAWIYTPRYSFRYDGRWLMTQLRVAAADLPAPATSPDMYGPDIIDRWKARAFQQDPSSDTPCCGYEEEDTNWGGSSILMGERVGAVRAIRETWGADSSTNNARREIFYRDLFVWGDSLRVHPIPPLDGIYSQWDHNAGIVTRYYNPMLPNGVAVDGRNDEAFGNFDDPCNPRYDGRNTTIDETYRRTYKQLGLCNSWPFHQSIDVSDPTFSGAQALQWEQASGPFGGMVTRTVIRDHSPGGDAQSLLAVPYYRDDSCFDDGTGTDPGPRRYERRSSEAMTYTIPGDPTARARACWASNDAIDTSFVAGADPGPDGRLGTGDDLGDEFGDERYFQGSIGTHGVHILLIAESDNAYATVPATEITTEQRVVVLPPTTENVGARYGMYVEFPLIARATPRG